MGFSASKLQLADNYATVYPSMSWGSTPTNLTELASTAPFQTVFADSQIKRYFLNTWTFSNGTDQSWVTDISRFELEAEYREIYNLGVYLLGNYSNKTFIINQWEGDWSLMGNFNIYTNVPPYRAERMAANISVRQRAISDARKTVSSTSTLLHSVEVNRCLDPFGLRVHRDVFPISRPDIVSFSLYEAINTWGNQATTEANIQELFTKAIRVVKRKVGNYVPMMIGEFGWPENDSGFIFNGLSAGPLIQKVTDIANANNFTDMYYWQIYDNEELSPGNPRGYYLIDRTGSYSQAGTKYLSLLA